MAPRGRADKGRDGKALGGDPRLRPQATAWILPEMGLELADEPAAAEDEKSHA